MSIEYTYSPDGSRVLECRERMSDGSLIISRRDWDGDAGLTFFETRRADGATFWGWADDTDLSDGPYLSEAQARAEAEAFFLQAHGCPSCGRLTMTLRCDDCVADTVTAG